MKVVEAIPIGTVVATGGSRTSIRDATNEESKQNQKGGP